MIFRLFLALALFLSAVESQAQLTCSAVHSGYQQGTALYYADKLDLLNQTYNEFVFDQSLVQFLQRDLSQERFAERTKARYQIFKLKRLLKKMKGAEDWDRYDFENFAAQLEKLAFLSDPSVTKNMSAKDRILYHQVQHSILSDGLENFLFGKRPVPLSVKRKVFNMLMIPFKSVYNRWFAAWLSMPKLHGAVIPWELALDVAWKGLDANREKLEPYKMNSQFKAYFNVFSTVYNWALVTAIFGVLPVYTYTVYKDLAEKGEQKAVAVFAPLVQHSREMAQTDYFKSTQDLALENFISEFKDKYQRDPNPTEIGLMKQLLKRS